MFCRSDVSVRCRGTIEVERLDFFFALWRLSCVFQKGLPLHFISISAGGKGHYYFILQHRVHLPFTNVISNFFLLIFKVIFW